MVFDDNNLIQAKATIVSGGLLTLPSLTGGLLFFIAIAR
jgi:hypothetical protein